MLTIYDNNYKELLETLDKYCCFGDELYQATYRDDIINPLKCATNLPKWTYDTGATKLVLIFHGMDTVIKIPFTGSDETHYCGGDMAASCPKEYSCVKKGTWCTNCCGCSYYDCPRRGHYEYSTFYGANASNGWDYCEAEVRYFELAEEIGLDECFAKVWRIGEICGHPIYAQVRAEMFEGESSRRSYSAEKLTSVRKTIEEKMDFYCFNEYWLSDFNDFFGEEKMEKLLKFLSTESIEDLHDGNLGYVCGVPVLVDFAGYYD